MGISSRKQPMRHSSQPAPFSKVRSSAPVANGSASGSGRAVNEDRNLLVIFGLQKGDLIAQLLTPVN